MMKSTSNLSLSKWQIAILLGTPAALGIGYYVYRKRNNNKSTNSNTTSTDKTASKLFDSKNKSISLDDNNQVLDPKKTEINLGKILPIDEAQRYKNDGNICYRNGKFDEAIKFYDKAIERCPIENNIDLSIFYQNRAAAYEMLKKWNHVKEDCTKSLEYNPRYPKAYFRRAKAYEATQNLLECLDDVTATCILEVFHNNNTIMFADRILKQTGNIDAIEGMKTRIPILPSKQFIETYFRSFTSDPLKKFKFNDYDINQIPPIGFIKAKLAWDNDNFEDIIPACTDEIELSEGESEYKIEATLLRGTFNMLRGCFTEANQDLNAVIENVDASVSLRVNALLKRASLYVQTDEKTLGLNDYEAAEKLEPNNPDIYHQRAQIYTLLEELDKALIDFDKAVQLAPKNGMAYVQKCYAEYRMSYITQNEARLVKVMNDFKNAVDKFPNCVECYSLMAQVLCDQGQFEQADTFFEKALKILPDNASLYVHRGIMYLQWNGNMEKAIQLINQSIEVDEKCELAYETLGTIEVQRANLDRAIELFELAIKYAKSNTEMAHLYSLRNAAVAQINVTKKLGIDMSTISALAQAGSQLQ